MKELIQRIKMNDEDTDLFISNIGNIYRQKSNGEFKELKTTSRRYVEFKTTIKGVYHHLSIHRLVAEYFVPGRTKEKNVVHHIDANPKNNVYTNLMWVTQDFNVKQEEIGFDRNKKETSLYKDGVFIKKFNTQQEAGDYIKSLGFSKSALIRYKKTAGFEIN